jgi:nitrogen fixation/metabolism regulation signal transduction histidine kinase
MSPVLASSGEYGYVAANIRFGANQGSSETKKPITCPRLLHQPVALCIRYGVIHQSHLAVNACDAMPNGGRLSVSSRAEKGYVKIEFCDSGIGINDGDLGKIFDPMFTTKPGGTGFGLAVCKEIVERHGGTISVAAGNDGAKGTIFTINLPIAG